MAHRKMTAIDKIETKQDAINACNNCGMLREDWFENNGKGVERDGVSYCSVICAYDDEMPLVANDRRHSK